MIDPGSFTSSSVGSKDLNKEQKNILEGFSYEKNIKN